MLDTLMMLEAAWFQIHETQCTQGCYKTSFTVSSTVYWIIQIVINKPVILNLGILKQYKEL